MARERNDFGAHQQILFLNGNLQKAIKEYQTGKQEKPFEYRHYGLMYPKAIKHYSQMGFALLWHRDLKDSTKSYWSFMLPKDSKTPVIEP